MNKVQVKVDLFEKRLKAEGMEDEYKRVDISEGVVGFETLKRLKDRECPIIIIFGDDIFTTVEYLVYTLYNLDIKERVLNKLNDMNKNNELLKFYIDDKNNIIGRFTYVAAQHKFHVDLLDLLIHECFEQIEGKLFLEIINTVSLNYWA